MQHQGTWAFIKLVTRPFRLYIAGMLFVSFMWALLVNVQPYLMKLILNAVGKGCETDVCSSLGMLLAIYIASEYIYIFIFRHSCIN